MTSMIQFKIANYMINTYPT